MRKVQIVGILNVTPDSFHDGGKFVSIETAVKQAGQMLQDGADFIEIGGESTGPTSKDVSLEKELSRVIPVLQAIRTSHPSAKIAVDTYKAAVAEAAIKEGAVMVNDVTAGRADSTMFEAIARSHARLVLMYAKDPTPRTTISERHYDDVLKTIIAFLAERKEKTIAAGISADRIILDPGLGHFLSSDPRYSFEVLERLGECQVLGCPILVSPSRKSFLAGPKNLPPSQRLSGTIEASVLAAKNGANYVRTHDVAEVRRALYVL